MEMFCFGIFAGMILAVIFIAGGVVYAQRDIKRTDDVDSDIRVYVPSRDRVRSSDKRDNSQVEERLNVLQTLRIGSNRNEKTVLDYYINQIRGEIEMDIKNKYKFYCDNEDFRIYVDKCAKTYNKTINEILESPITEEYYLLLLEKEKANKDEN